MVYPQWSRISPWMKTSLAPGRVALPGKDRHLHDGGRRRQDQSNAALYLEHGRQRASYGPLQGLEVAVRNGMHLALTASYGAAWYDNGACDFDAGTLNRIVSAKDDLRRDGYPVDPSHLVAALPFGFWVALLGRGGRSAALGSPKRNYEMTLWRPCLFRAFPHTRSSRIQVHQPLDYLRTFAIASPTMSRSSRGTLRPTTPRS